MDPGAISEVRRFNRTVTQELGVLHDHFLRRGRPLGEARVLWEIGSEGADVRALRSRLDLDSGYLSRVLRALEGAGLVTVGTNPADKRVRTARLDAAPAAASERCSTRRSDELAASFLEPLDAHQQARLVAAMRDVERLLTARSDRDHRDRSRRTRCAQLHRCVLRRARHALRHGLRSGAEHLRGRRRAAPARRRAPRRAPAVATDRLWRVEVPSPRPDRDQAHVGRARRTRSRCRAQTARRARTAGPRTREPQGAAPAFAGLL